MTEFHLTALKGNEPITFLAALGVLKCATEMIKDKRPTLHWENDGLWTAVITANTDDLVNMLIKHRDSRKRDDLNWADDIKVDPDNFSRNAREILERATGWSDPIPNFFAAFGSDMVNAKSTSDIKPTAFYMLSGKQSILKELREIFCSLDAAAYKEALYGPWKYQDQFHPLGWDPSCERLYAYRARNPSPEKITSVRAAVWLAYEALSLFPTFAIGNRLYTTGFISSNKQTAFIWPIWAVRVSLDVVRSLLTMNSLFGKLHNEDLRQRGVVAIFESEKKDLGEHGYSVFKPAKQIF